MASIRSAVDQLSEGSLDGDISRSTGYTGLKSYPLTCTCTGGWTMTRVKLPIELVPLCNSPNTRSEQCQIVQIRKPPAVINFLGSMNILSYHLYHFSVVHEKIGTCVTVTVVDLAGAIAKSAVSHSQTFSQ